VTPERARSGSPDAGAATPAVAASVRSRSLVLGLGNTLLGDDGVGIRLVERLRSEDCFPCTGYVDGGTLSFSLLEHIEQAEAMVVIDAAELDAAPGTIGVFEDEAMDRYLASPRRRSVHEVSLSDLLDMARLQDCLPRHRALVCVQPAYLGWSEALSEPVVAALAQAQAQVAAILERWSGQA
jgi:hydrogenase maturation protease